MATVYFGSIDHTPDGDWNNVSNWYSYYGFSTSSGSAPGILLGRLPNASDEVTLNNFVVTTGPSMPYTGIVYDGTLQSGTFSGIVYGCNISGTVIINGTCASLPINTKSTDGGTTYSITSIGGGGYVGNSYIYTIKNRIGSSRIYAKGSGGFSLAYTDDYGTNWATPTNLPSITADGITPTNLNSTFFYLSSLDYNLYKWNNGNSTYAGTVGGGFANSFKMVVSDDLTRMIFIGSFTAANIRVSSNSGSTFANKAISATWGSLAGDSTAQYLVAATTASGPLYVSTDFGNNWATSGTTRTYSSVAVSPDGSTMYAMSTSGTLSKSTNQGTSWSIVTNPLGSQPGVTVSVLNTNGSFIAIQNGGFGAALNLYTSTNYGASWSTQMVLPFPSSSQGPVFISSDGTNVLTFPLYSTSSRGLNISGGTINGDVVSSNGNISGGTINGNVRKQKNVPNTNVLISGGTYSPAATVTVSKTAVTGYPEDPGFVVGGGTFSPRLTIQGFPDILAAGLL